jgi:hypothetical protein
MQTNALQHRHAAAASRSRCPRPRATSGKARYRIVLDADFA